MAGDLVFNCTGGTNTPQGSAVPQTNIQVFLNTSLAITSRLIGSGSEALLMIDEPFVESDQVLCTTPLTGCSLNGVGTDSVAQQNDYKRGRVSVFQGVPAGLNSVVFHGVPIDPPGEALDGNGSPLVRTIRITNLRVNASQFHGSGVTPVTASVSASPSATFPINSQTIQTIAYILPGLVTTYSSVTLPAAFSYPQCFSASNVPIGDVTFAEGFGTAFKTRTSGQSGDFGVTVPHTGATVVGTQDLPGQFLNTESGFFNPLLGLGADPGGAGLVDFGTRFKVMFTNVPAGVTISGPSGFVSNDPNNPFALLTVHQTATEAGPFNPSAANTFTATSTVSSHTFFYEVTDADISSERVTVSFKGSWSGPPHAPALGTVKMAGWFAPTSTNQSAGTEGVAPIPRFQDFSQSVDAFTIVPQCITGPPTVLSFNVLFGSQSYNVLTSGRHRLPWDIIGIRVFFSKPIASGGAASLSGTGVNGLSGLGSSVLTWSINDVSKGSLSIALAGSGPYALKDQSGNGLAGGAGFTRALKILLGDFNDDGSVSAADMVGVNNSRTAPYNILADINGDGVVDLGDVMTVRARVGTTQP